MNKILKHKGLPITILFVYVNIGNLEIIMTTGIFEKVK